MVVIANGKGVSHRVVVGQISSLVVTHGRQSLQGAVGPKGRMGRDESIHGPAVT